MIFFTMNPNLRLKKMGRGAWTEWGGGRISEFVTKNLNKKREFTFFCCFFPGWGEGEGELE